MSRKDAKLEKDCYKNLAFLIPYNLRVNFIVFQASKPWQLPLQFQPVTFSVYIRQSSCGVNFHANNICQPFFS
jgi:hypothetical protein